MAIIVPLEPDAGFVGVGSQADAQPGDAAGEPPVPTVPSPTGWQPAPSGHRHATRGGEGHLGPFVGIALVLFGALALVDAFLPAWADGGRFLWPAFILGIGAILVASAIRREPTQP